MKPALIVGDFDSHCNPHLDVETIVLPCEKDDTDTVFAVKTMVQRGYDDFLLIGVIGARLDHTLGNVSILLYLDSLGKRRRSWTTIRRCRSSRRTKSPSRISTRFSRCSISRAVRGDYDPRCEVPARRRGDHVRIPVRREQRGPARKDSEDLRAGWKAPAYQNLQTVSETKSSRPTACCFCCVWIVISRWERRQETACRCHPHFQGTRRTS